MRIPIAHTLAWPKRMATPCTPLDLAAAGRLDFERPDELRFPALRIARAAGEAGGAMPAVLNAANEVAVAAFLNRHIGFLDISAIVERVMAGYSGPEPATVGDVLDTDRAARDAARRLTENVKAQ